MSHELSKQSQGKKYQILSAEHEKLRRISWP